MPSLNVKFKFIQHLYAHVCVLSSLGCLSYRSETRRSIPRISPSPLLWVGGSISRVAKMSRRNGNAPKLDLKLNLSPPRVNRERVSSSSPSRSATESPTSPPSSCVSSETDLRYSNSPEATSMVLAGCSRCLMYVMLSEEDPKCPKCKSPVLLDFIRNSGSGGRRNKRS